MKKGLKPYLKDLALKAKILTANCCFSIFSIFLDSFVDSKAPMILQNLYSLLVIVQEHTKMFEHLECSHWPWTH